MFIAVIPIAAQCEPISNVVGDIGDYGTWATEHNRAEVIGNLKNDLENFFPSGDENPLVHDGVPIDARIGLAFINALSFVAHVLDSVLVRFAIIFMIIAYAFWIFMETYNMMTTTSDVKKLVTELVKKGAIMAIWIAILEFGLARVFMMIVGPIITIGAYLSDVILNAITVTIGTTLPDTCNAIHEYARIHASSDIMIDASNAADIMCVPSRMTALAATGIAAGWHWMVAGIGHSAFTFVAGVACIILFGFLLWKFSVTAFGVIADLFLAVLMLPFTAIAETTNKTSYKGIAGNIYNGFLGLFKTEKLEKQVMRFINATIYFVSLSVVIGLCGALMAGAIDANLLGDVPSVESGGFITLMLTGALIAYIAYKGQEIAKNLGGSIDTSFGTQVVKDGEQLLSNAKSNYDKAKDTFREIRYILKSKRSTP